MYGLFSRSVEYNMAREMNPLLSGILAFAADILILMTKGIGLVISMCTLCLKAVRRWLYSFEVINNCC